MSKKPKDASLTIEPNQDAERGSFKNFRLVKIAGFGGGEDTVEVEAELLPRGGSSDDFRDWIADKLSDQIEKFSPQDDGIDLIVVPSHGGRRLELNYRPSNKEDPDDLGDFGVGEITYWTYGQLEKRVADRVSGKSVVTHGPGAGKSALSLYWPLFGEPAHEPGPPPQPLGTGELADRMLPDAPIPSPAQALLAQRETALRWQMLQEFGAFTSEELADRRSHARNRHALANRWRREGKVLAVEVRGRRLYPGFQFDPETFAPLPIVARVLAALPREEMSEWETALWWVAADPRLAGRRPVDVIGEEPLAVLAAAEGLAEPSPL